MATWHEVREMLLGIPSYNFVLDTENIVSVIVNTERGRDQKVYICNEGDSVSINAAVCKLEDVDLNKLFTAPLMRDLTYGLGVMTNHLAVKHLQLLETLDAPEVTKPIIRLAFLADALEEKLTGLDAY
jgi:hypothetical protein